MGINSEILHADSWKGDKSRGEKVKEWERKRKSFRFVVVREKMVKSGRDKRRGDNTSSSSFRQSRLC